MGDLGPEVIEVIEDEDEAADEDAEVEEARAASHAHGLWCSTRWGSLWVPAGEMDDWIASEGEVSSVDSDKDSTWDNWDNESFTSSSDISNSDDISLLTDTPGRPAAGHVRCVVSDDEE